MFPSCNHSSCVTFQFVRWPRFKRSFNLGSFSQSSTRKDKTRTGSNSSITISLRDVHFSFVINQHFIYFYPISIHYCTVMFESQQLLLLGFFSHLCVSCRWTVPSPWCAWQRSGRSRVCSGWATTWSPWKPWCTRRHAN